jgi:hypothetical protein
MTCLNSPATLGSPRLDDVNGSRKFPPDGCGFNADTAANLPEIVPLVPSS